MIGLMVSIFSIVMILIYFASPISRDDEVGHGVGLMFGIHGIAKWRALTKF